MDLNLLLKFRSTILWKLLYHSFIDAFYTYLLLLTNVKSINETLGVGTLIATHQSFPLSLVKQDLIAFAAPVDVGIIESPEALALLNL